MTQLPKPNDAKVLVIGWDAADWRAIRPLLEQGKMPHLQRMMDEGVHGNNSTLNPVLSPMLWTSIGTGKRPYKHGIHGFSEPTPDGKAVRPITNVSRKSKAVWNMLNQVGKKCNVVAWWPSHPAEPIDGVMVSNWYQTARNLKNTDIDPEIGRPRPDAHGWAPEQWEMAPGTVHPESLSRNLQEFRFHPMELGAEHVGPFIPKFMEIDQKKDQRLTGFAKTLSDTVSVHGAATALMQLEPWDFMAVYYDGIDHFGHGFMKYHPPRQDFIKEEDFELYKDVVEGGYRFHDMMLGALLQLAGEDTTVILVSDHGFHPDHLRPEHIPAEPAGPAIEHRPYGIFVARGPGIRKGEVVHGASVLDLTPTVLACFGLPVGADMDGKPLVTIFEETPEIATVPNWDDIDGPHPDGMHPPDAHLDSVQSAEAMKQLVELGYIEELNEDTNEAVRETVRELNYNLAQANMDGGRFAEAAELLEPMWNDWPREHRFGLNYIACLSALDRVDERGLAIERLAQNVKAAMEWATEELERIRPEAEEYGIKLPRLKSAGSGTEPDVLPEAESAEAEAEAEKDEPRKDPPKKLTFQIRKIMSLLQPMGPTLEWLLAQQAIQNGEKETVKPFLDKMSEATSESPKPEIHNQIGQSFLRIGAVAEAKTSFERAMKTDDENSDGRRGLAEVAVLESDWEAAVEHALTATELFFQNPMAHYLLARGLEGLGDDDHAKIAYGVAITQAPGFRAAREHHLAQLERLGESAAGAEQKAAVEAIAAASVLEDAAAADDVDKVAAVIEQRRAERRGAPTANSSSGDAVDVPSDQPPVVIVSGLPRSGTSMMMQMLDAGGLPAYTDEKREADSDNPRGYYEHENATRLASNRDWVPESRGKAVKIVAQLLAYLPRGERYRIVFMDRDLRDIVRSQRVMLDRLGREGGRLSPGRMMTTLDAQVAQVERLLANRPDIEAIFVDYDEVIGDPAGVSARIAGFVDGLDEAAMVAAVDGSLRRQSSNG